MLAGVCGAREPIGHCMMIGADTVLRLPQEWQGDEVTVERNGSGDSVPTW